MKQFLKALALIAIISIALLLISSTPSVPSTRGVDVSSEVVNLDGMTYRVFTAKSSYDNYIDIAVVNVTKEKLEIQKLKAEIEYYKKLR